MPVDIKKIKQFWEQDTARKQALGIYGKRDGRDFFTIKDDGEYEVRVLELGTFYAGSHWGILQGREGRNGGTVKCPRVFDGSPCPVCELVEQMANSEDTKDRKQAEEWAVQVKHPILLVDMNEEGGKIVPRIYEAPKTVFGGIVKYLTNPKYGNILDIEQGRNVTISRQKDGKGITKYDVICDPERTSIDVDTEKLPSLEEMLKPPAYEDIEYAIQNGEFPPKKDKEEEDKPKRSFTKSSAPGAPAPYKKGLPGPKTRDEEPEEAPEEDEQQEEEAPPPPPKRPSLMTGRLAPKPKKQEPVEEEQEEEPQGEEPEEAPPAKPAPKAASTGNGLSVKERLAALKAKKGK